MRNIRAQRQPLKGPKEVDLPPRTFLTRGPWRLVAVRGCTTQAGRIFAMGSRKKLQRWVRKNHKHTTNLKQMQTDEV